MKNTVNNVKKKKFMKEFFISIKNDMFYFENVLLKNSNKDTILLCPKIKKFSFFFDFVIGDDEITQGMNFNIDKYLKFKSCF